MSQDASESKEPSLVVEPAKPADAVGIAGVQTITWINTYPNAELGISKEDIRKRVEGEHGELIPQKIERWRSRITPSDRHAVFVVQDNKKVIGFVAPVIDNGRRRVGAIYVLPEAQGKGVGGKLLQKAIDWHGRKEDIFLHVASYNHRAISFYKKFGFEETGRAVTDEVAQLSGGKAIPEIEMVLKKI